MTEALVRWRASSARRVGESRSSAPCRCQASWPTMTGVIAAWSGEASTEADHPTTRSRASRSPTQRQMLGRPRNRTRCRQARGSVRNLQESRGGLVAEASTPQALREQRMDTRGERGELDERGATSATSRLNNSDSASSCSST